MYTKSELNSLYERVIKTIDISNEMFDVAEKAYKELGDWIDAKTPTYKIEIYPQGSFALGTVIKPIGDSEDYDLDLVCEFASQYGLSAEKLKCDVVKPLLERYKKIKGKILNKKRCWHVEYEDLPNFHMDIIPAVHRKLAKDYIDITDHDEDKDQYDYIGSNPLGYIEWFNKRKETRHKILLEQYCNENRHMITCQADVAKLKEYNFKTPLQKAIQLLKRHRDIMYEDDTNNLKPISIIITTLAAQLYNDEDNIVDALTNILNKIEPHLKSKMVDGVYHVDNPSYTGSDVENFADKWAEHPERKDAFFSWIRKAKADLIDARVYSLNRVAMAQNINESLGIITGKRVFEEMAKEDRESILQQKKRIEPQTGRLSSTGTIPVPPNHNHGQVS